MAVNLSPIGGVAAQFFDNSGNILSGGKIYTYTAGTTTPQTTYTSSSGATAHANPIILDAAGRVPSGEIWLTDGLQYKFLIKTSTDVQIGSYDNIIGINSNFVNYTNSQEFQTATAGQTVFTLTTMVYQPGTGSLSVFVDGVNQYGPGALYAFQETSDTVVTFTAGLHVGAEVKFTTSAINASSYGDAQQVSYTPPFANSVSTNVESKLAQTVSVMDFGATGNGVTDDTAAIQAAINAVRAADGGTVFVPAGAYVCSATIVLKQGVNLVGEGRAHQAFYASDPRGSVLLITVGAGQNAVEFEGGVKGHYGIYNLAIFEAGSSAFNAIVSIGGVLHPVLEDVELSCLNTRRGIGLELKRIGGALTLYGSFRNLVAHNVIDGIKILDDTNACSFVGGSINCSRFALVMDGTLSFPTATAFTGMSFECNYVAADTDVTYFTTPNNIQGWDINQTNGYRFNFVNVVKSVGTMFSGCYFELGGYPNPYNDGVNGSHPAIATVSVEPSTSLDAQSTGFYNCRFSASYIYDTGTNTRANNIASILNYSNETPSVLALRRTTTQTFTALAWTQIGYSASALVNDGSIRFNTSTTATFTQKGVYMFVANISLAATTATSDFVQLRADHSGTIYYGANYPKTSVTNLNVGATVSGLINVSVGDTLKIEFFNASSSGSMVSTANQNELFIVKIT